jgi:hypothetical protein
MESGWQETLDDAGQYNLEALSLAPQFTVLTILAMDPKVNICNNLAVVQRPQLSSRRARSVGLLSSDGHLHTRFSSREYNSMWLGHAGISKLYNLKHYTTTNYQHYAVSA